MGRQIWGRGASDIRHKKHDLGAAKVLCAKGVDLMLQAKKERQRNFSGGLRLHCCGRCKKRIKIPLPSKKRSVGTAGDAGTRLGFHLYRRHVVA